MFVKTLIIFCVALLGCISLVEAAEPQLTGNQLVPSCREYLKKPQAVSACAALLRGVFEGHLQGAVAYGLLHNVSQFKDLPFVWCPTDKSTVSDAQLVAPYTKYVSAKPEVSERPAANIAATVFMLSWPCRN